MITRLMLAKISSENVKALGAADAAEFDAKLTKFIADSKLMAESKVTLETLATSITELEGKLISETRIKELVAEGAGSAATTAISTWATSEAGKKIIGGEASRITAEALANVGTQPAKPAPVGADASNATAVQNLEAQGKFEEAWAADKNIQAEFPTAKGYAAFRRAQINGQVRITIK